jgi:hypothetical protein
MSIELSAEQRAVLQQTRRAETPAEFQALLKAAKPEMDRIVREVMEANQPIGTTLTELRDLYLSVSLYDKALTTKRYGAPRRQLFASAIRLLDTALVWFGEGARTGAYRVRSVDEVIQASRPWRERIKALGEHAFAFEPDIAEQFADVNSTGTLDEERADLKTLTQAIDQHRERLEEVGLTEELVAEGQALLEEADGRDLLGVLGLRNREDAVAVRNRILTYAILLGREARAAGINACFDDEEAKRRFEASSFRNAIRRLRRRRRGGGDGSGEPEPEPTGTV